VYEHVFVDGPNLKGAVAEMRIATAATELGVPVLRPVAEHGRYDLVLDLEERLIRVPRKWGSLVRDRSVINVSLALVPPSATSVGQAASPS